VQKKGSNVQINGTGFGPSAQVTIDGVAATTTYFSSTLLVANVPTSITNGLKPVVVVNPEGCQSQELASVTVQPPGSCGLTGIEPFLLLGLLGTRRLRLLIA
jgi:hypothetical protein